MKEQLLKINNRGVSEIVSYSILIIIAVAISVLVFNFLFMQIPKGQVSECPADIHISAEDIECNANINQISFTLVNRGFFSVNEIHLRLREQDRAVQLVTNKTLSASDFESEVGDTRFNPGEEFEYSISPDDVSFSTGVEFSLEVQPAIYNEDRVLVLCPTIISQRVQC